MDSPPNDWDRGPGWDQGPGIAESIRLHKGLVALCVLVFAVAAYAWSARQPVRYEGVAKLFLDIDSERSANSDRIVRREAEFLSSSEVTDRVVRLLDGRLTPQQLEKQLTIEPSTDADLITIRALDATPELAGKLADTVPLAYRQVLAAQAEASAKATVADLERESAQLEKELTLLEAARRSNPGSPARQADIDAKLQELRRIAERKEQANLNAQRASQPSTLRDRATVSDEPAQPKPRRAAAIGAMVGLLLGAALALWRTGWRPAAEAAYSPAQPLEASSPKVVRQGREKLGSLLRPSGHRRAEVAIKPNGSITGNGSRSGIADFDELSISVQQILHLLDGRRQRLYEQDVPQLTADEIVHQFPFDVVAVLLENGDGVLRVSGGVGLSSLERRMAIRHDSQRLKQSLDAGPRLVGKKERALLASAGMPGSQLNSLVMVPFVQDGVGFGMLLAGQETSESQAQPIGDQEVEDLANNVNHLVPYLYAWVRLRNLKSRLETLS